MSDKLKLLKRYWGYDSFRPRQEEIIDSLLQGHDTLALLPTGGGKSLCYQLPALMQEGMALVVSPLIALMKDQVQQLNDRHIHAACITSGMSALAVTGVLNNALSGALKFLYVSPERLQQRRFIEHFRRMKVCLIAVDEAHCVSQWGYDFRPPYLQVAAIRAYHPSVPLVALTATATPQVVQDILLRLEMRGAVCVKSSFERANLAYMVLHDSDKLSRLLRVVRGVRGCGIVYTRNRRGTQSTAAFLSANGISATFYHAGLSSAERDRRQALWMKGQCQVMVATNAFGMGIDKSDVRFVVHLDVPDSLEAYFQEAGRAGRDGFQSYAVLLCDETDRMRLERDFNASYPTVDQIRNVYRALGNYYRLPVGSGGDTRANFDIERLCESYKFNVREFYSACQFLEREGLIAIPDREEMASTLYVPMPKDELYRFQVDHVRLGNLLQLLLRLYPGLMTEPVPVDERRIGEKCYAKASEVMTMLVQLREMRVVEYHPRSTKPQIIFTSPRVDEKDIYPSADHYQGLKNAAWQRLQAVLEYVSDGEHCRSRQLLAYFGEEGADNCGVCDVCRRIGRKPSSVREAIRRELGRRRLDSANLCDILIGQGYTEVRETLREMLDQGKLSLDANFCLYTVG